MSENAMTFTSLVIWAAARSRMLAFCLSMTSLVGCATTLVQPYDQKLVDDTEAIFKDAAAMIDDGVQVSPMTDEARKAIRNPSGNPAHLSKFEDRYQKLATSTDLLILRALAQSRGVDAIGQRLQDKVSDLVDQQLPSQCEELEREFGAPGASLTVRNYVDLKCIFVRWHDQHADMVVTEGTQILKKGNWELRKSTVFNAVLAIQRAESSKKQ